MRRFRTVAMFAVGGLLIATLPLLAHHSPQAEFDLLATPKEMTGTFNRLEWANPHPYMFVLQKDPTGKEHRWSFEMNGIQAMRKAGFERTFLKWGDVLVIEYYPARDGSDHGLVTKFTLPDGRKFEHLYEPTSGPSQ